MLRGLVLAALGVPAASCASDEDCSLLGTCTVGSCACDEGWTGADCAVLSLLPPVPLTEDGSSYIAPKNYSSWGMSVVHDVGDNMFHGFVSEFEYGCDLDSWGTNSFVNHVVSKTPAGPYKQAGVALPVWAHNPKLVYSKQEKLWIMYHIGAGNEPSKAKHCRPNDQRLMAAPAAAATAADSSARPFEIHTASSLAGPWTPVSASSTNGAPGGDGLGSSAGSSSLFTLYPVRAARTPAWDSTHSSSCVRL
jgi:hypothetical protein